MKEADRARVDREILQALLEDGRKSHREVAAEVGVSPSHVTRRLAALEDAGVVKGYQAQLDMDALGLGLIALVLIKARGPEIPRLVRRLAADPSLVSVYEITGTYDIAVLGRFPNREEMNAKIKGILGDTAIEGTNTSIVLSVQKENGAPRLP